MSIKQTVVPDPVVSATDPTADPPSVIQYNNWAFEPILQQQFNQLRARLLNLAESSTRDKSQAEAMKGLMKDFCNQAYYACRDQMEAFARDKGIIQKGEGQCQPPVRWAKSMSDILYEPE